MGLYWIHFIERCMNLLEQIVRYRRIYFKLTIQKQFSNKMQTQRWYVIILTVEKTDRQYKVMHTAA